MSKALQSLIFFGATAFPEVAEIVRDINSKKMLYKIIGILDDNTSLHGLKLEGVPVLGPLKMAHDYQDALFVHAIGSYRTRIIRYEIINRIGIPDERYATLIHPSAKIYSSSSIGSGSIIHSGAVITNDTTIEPFSIILFNTVIGVRNIVGQGALIASLVTTATDVQIGPFSFIGTGSCVAEGVRVGPGAMIGMGSIVLRDVKPGVFQFGNPPRLLDKVEVPPELLNRWQNNR